MSKPAIKSANDVKCLSVNVLLGAGDKYNYSIYIARGTWSVTTLQV